MSEGPIIPGIVYVPDPDSAEAVGTGDRTFEVKFKAVARCTKCWSTDVRISANQTNSRCLACGMIDLNMTVGELISELQKLPPDTVLYEMTWDSNRPTHANEFISVYERDGEVRLYLDTGEASHPKIDRYCRPLVEGLEEDYPWEPL